MVPKILETYQYGPKPGQDLTAQAELPEALPKVTVNVRLPSVGAGSMPIKLSMAHDYFTKIMEKHANGFLANPVYVAKESLKYADALLRAYETDATTGSGQ